MTALTAPRATPSLETGANLWRNFPVLADAIVYPGALVAINASGYLTPGEASASLRCVGVAVPKREQMDRDGIVDATDLASGALTCEVQSCLALMANGSTSITIADVGNDCYILDDQTVTRTNGSSAGTGQVSELTVTPAGAGSVSVTFNGFAPTEAFVSSNVLATDNISLRNAINTHPQLIAAMSAPATVSLGRVIVTFSPAAALTSFADASAGGPSVAHSVTTPNVAPGAATRSVAGRVWQVESRGVWVALGTTP